MTRRVQGHDTGAAGTPASTAGTPSPRPITETLAGAAGGVGGLVVLEAPGPGALRAAAEQAREQGLHVLVAEAGGDAAPETPFGVARDLFAPALAELDEAEREAVLVGAPRLAEPLLRPGTGRPDPPPGGEMATVHGFYWLAANLADRRPLAVLVEAAHRADEPSLRVCRYLAQRIEELPVALLLGAEPGWSLGSAALSA